jgi:hypothetical protein
MEYIWDEIIPTKKCISKPMLLVESFVNFCVVNDIDIHQLILRPFSCLKILVENPFKKCVFPNLLIINPT